MRFKEWVEKATKQQLKEKLLQYNEMWLKFDQFLIDELGEETYADIAREFGIKQSAEFLLKLGASEAEVREFADSLKGERKPQA